MSGVLIFSVLAIIAIIVASSFGLHIYPIIPIHALPDSVADSALYVCPLASETFDEIAKQLSLIHNSLLIIFSFVFMLWIAMILWSLYQNLLKDKFNEKNWNNVKFLGKVLFWLAVVVTILLHSPNSYRGVKLKGATGEYILCEASDPMSKPVHAKAVLAGD